MKLINALGPNPRMVRMFLLEKSIDLPMQDIDILGAENRRLPYAEKNPAGQIPSLELDDGTVIAETVAICEYLDEAMPAKCTLVGSTPKEKAVSRMWQRRVELNITEHIYNGFRYGEGLGFFKDRIHTIPEASPGLKENARRNLRWLDPLIAGRPFICGDAVRIADLALFCCLDFANHAGQPLDPQLKHLTAWFSRMSERSSAAASVYPGWEASGVKG